MDDVGGRGQVQTRAAGLQREYEEGRPVLGLERVHQVPAFLHRHTPVQDRAAAVENARQELRERLGHLAELGEDEHFFLARGDLLGDLSEPLELAAFSGDVVPGTNPLGRMVADLLEAHEKGQDRAAPLNAVQAVQVPPELLDRLLIEHGLFAGERAEGLDFDLVRKVEDHGGVGLQAAQYIRPSQGSQGGVRVRRPVLQGPGEGLELLEGAEEARAEEIEERP